MFDAGALEPGVRERIVRDVRAVYRWIDRRVERAGAGAVSPGASPRTASPRAAGEAGQTVAACAWETDSTPGGGRWSAGCRACGACCDFEAYDHRLFVTSPELVYFAAMMAAAGSAGGVRRMVGGVCPYREGRLCTVHEHRFAGCRIFCCAGPVEASAQAELSERAVRCFKAICRRHGLGYRYLDLKAALEVCRTGGVRG